MYYTTIKLEFNKIYQISILYMNRKDFPPLFRAIYCFFDFPQSVLVLSTKY